MSVSAITPSTQNEPQLQIASRSLKQAVNSGFKWDNEEQLWNKLNSEIDEFKRADSPESKEDEFGDILHSLVSIANWHNVDPQTAMTNANQKFISRFKITEKLVAQDKKTMSDLNLKEILKYWSQAKQQVSENENNLNLYT